MILRHFGADEYKPELFKPIKDSHFVKPRGGLWTSPVGSNYGWKEWCEAEEFGDVTTWFDVEFVGTLLVIDSLNDAKTKLSWCEPRPGWSFPLFEVLVVCGFDAIHLTERGQHETRFSRPSLYGWDCESVLIMNPETITELARQPPSV